MRFLGRDSAETYGELVSWDQDSKARKCLLRWRDVSPGEGLWILEIQDRVYQFLLDVCRQILHDTDLAIATLLARPEEPEPVVITANKLGDGLATSLITLRYEAAYNVPSKLNIGRLQDLIAAKLAEVEDTIWALREDPALFIATLDERYTHRSEQMLDTDGEKHPVLNSGPGPRAAFEGRVVGSVMGYYLPALG